MNSAQVAEARKPASAIVWRIEALQRGSRARRRAKPQTAAESATSAANAANAIAAVEVELEARRGAGLILTEKVLVLDRTVGAVVPVWLAAGDPLVLGLPVAPPAAANAGAVPNAMSTNAPARMLAGEGSDRRLCRELVNGFMLARGCAQESRSSIAASASRSTCSGGCSASITRSRPGSSRARSS